MSQQRTTAEELEHMRRLVSWTLWKMANDDVYVHAQGRADAQDLFHDRNWIANVVGQYAANHYSEKDTYEWAQFKLNFDE